ncbi:zinc-binding dehydrogenase [Pasteurellaceae bacterium LIM206]|nr:zinc-binding dehydrogenase [Pasteurellaceae bacterium LIM206]
MQAFAITDKSHRSIEQISLIDVPVPVIAADQVLIKVKAVGLNPVDYKVVEFGVDAWQYPHILGLDVAGVIEAVGEGVDRFVVGDRVAGHGYLLKDGCFAQFVAVPAYQLGKIPDDVSFEQAAGLLCGAMTAFQALHRKASLNNRRTVLVHAAAGGVGSIAIQLAKLAGLTVYATAGTDKIDFVRRIGAADVIIDYKTEDITARVLELTQNRGVDLIINTIDGKTATEDLNRLAYNGALVAIVEEPDYRQSDLFRRGQSVCVVNLGGAHGSRDPAQQADLGRITQTLLNLVSQGKINPLIETVLPFENIPQGLQLIKRRKTVGKVVAVLK